MSAVQIRLPALKQKEPAFYVGSFLLAEKLNANHPTKIFRLGELIHYGDAINNVEVMERDS